MVSDTNTRVNTYADIHMHVCTQTHGNTKRRAHTDTHVNAHCADTSTHWQNTYTLRCHLNPPRSRHPSFLTSPLVLAGP